MRIAMLHPRPQRRGAEIFARQLAVELRERGHAVTELYLYPPPEERGLPSGPGEIHLARRRGLLERGVGWSPRVAHRLGEALRHLRPEVVQASGGAAVKYAAHAVSRLPDSPLLVYRNIGQPDRWVRGWRRRWLYHRHVFPHVTAVAAVAEAFVARVRELCPNALVVRYIPTGIDVEALQPTVGRSQVRAELDTPTDAPVVLFAGGLSSEKRVDRLLRAFGVASAARPEAHLWIAGSGPLASELQELSERNGTAAKVRFAGERDDVGNLLAASDLVALTSDTEGVPAVLHEAAWFGLPAVATRAGATAEAVADGETGRLVDRDDEAALAGALIEMIDDPERRRRMGEAARGKFARAGMTIGAVTGAYEELYAEGLARLRTESAG